MNAYIMNFIKSERIRMGLTQAALAQMIGVKKMLKNLENTGLFMIE